MLRIILFFVLCGGLHAPRNTPSRGTDQQAPLSEVRYLLPPPGFDASVNVDFFGNGMVTGDVKITNEDLKKKRFARISEMIKYGFEMESLLFKMQPNFICSNITLTAEVFALIKCWSSGIAELEDAFAQLSDEDKAYISSLEQNPFQAWFDMMQGRACEAPTYNLFVRAMVEVAKKNFKPKSRAAHIPEYFSHFRSRLGAGEACLMARVHHGAYANSRTLKINVAELKGQSLRKSLEKEMEKQFGDRAHGLEYKVTLMTPILSHYGSEVTEIQEGKFYSLELRRELTSIRRFSLSSEEHGEAGVLSVSDESLRDNKFVRGFLGTIYNTLAQKHPGHSFWLNDFACRIPFDLEKIRNISLTDMNNMLVSWHTYNKIDYGIFPQDGLEHTYRVNGKDAFYTSHERNMIHFQVELSSSDDLENMPPEWIASLNRPLKSISLTIGRYLVKVGLGYSSHLTFNERLLVALDAIEYSPKFFVPAKDPNDLGEEWESIEQGFQVTFEEGKKQSIEPTEYTEDLNNAFVLFLYLTQHKTHGLTLSRAHQELASYTFGRCIINALDDAGILEETLGRGIAKYVKTDKQ